MMLENQEKEVFPRQHHFLAHEWVVGMVEFEVTCCWCW